MGVAVIFGGCGFAGTHLARALVKSAQYQEVIVADISVPSQNVSGVRYVRCDVRQRIVLSVDDHIAEIYNLAAVHTTPGHPDYQYYETNVLGALRVTEFAAENKAPSIVFTSSISVYGPTDTLKNETSALNPVSAYGRSKVMAEEIHRCWQRAVPGRRLIIARPGVLYGEGEGGNFTRLAKALRSGWFFFPGRKDTVKACGYVGELIRSIDFVRRLNLPLVTYNFCYPRGYTIEEICESFERVAHYKKPRGVVPAKVLLLAAFFFEALNGIGLKNSVNRSRVRKLMDGTMIAPSFLLANGYTFETDLDDSLRLWRDADAQGRFV